MALMVENDRGGFRRFVTSVVCLGLAAAQVGLPVQATSLSAVRPLLLHCFRTTHAPSCQQSLLRIESLQRRAGAQDRYPCQTLLLGLQAEVVMVQLSVARGEKAFETLRESEQLCSGL